MPFDWPEDRLTPSDICAKAPCYVEILFDNGEQPVLNVKYANVDMNGYIHTIQTHDDRLYDGRHVVWMKQVYQNA